MNTRIGYANMSKEQLVSLWKERRDTLAMTALLRSIDPYLRLIARSLPTGQTYSEEEDIYIWAQLTAINCAERYDFNYSETNQADFFTFLVGTLKKASSKALREIRKDLLPQSYQELQPRLFKASQKLLQDLGRTPSFEELSEETGIPIRTIALIQSSRVSTLSELQVETEDGLELDNKTAIALSNFHEWNSADKRAELAVREAVEELPFPYFDIVRLLFYENFTIPEVAEILEMKVCKVRKIRINALRKLGRMLSETLEGF